MPAAIQCSRLTQRQRLAEGGDGRPRHAAKDLRLVAEAAAAADRDLEVAAAARARLDSAVESGAADLDFSAVVATILGEKPQP